jgi:hypothetical protein
VADEVKPEDKKPVDNVSDPLEGPHDEVDPLLEPEGAPDVPPAKVHPLTPGGRRFEQVYAEGKQAKRDLAKERDLRIAAEAKLEVLGGKKASETAGDTEYSWSQLEEFITQGRITRADAEAHREQVIEKRLSSKIKGDFTKEQSTVTRGQALQASIAQYIDAVPAIMTEGSEDRIRLDEEFEFLASVQGVDSSNLDDATRRALQLTALRTVYGSVDALAKRTVQPRTETHQGLPGGVRPKPSTNPDQTLLDGLSKAQVAHYTKMLSAGRYPGGWKDVVAELKFAPPVRVRR